MKSSLKTLVCALALAALAGCGAERGERFVATRVLAFGDETSVIDPIGRKYTINALQESDAAVVDCTANPLWIQTLAASFGRVFQECPGTATDASSRILAFPGARAADLAGQIDAFLAEPQAFRRGDLATVLIGQNDILALYAGRDASATPASLIAAAEALGGLVSAQVRRLADADVRVIVATVPDLGLTPYARAQGIDGAALLSSMTRRFNVAMLLELPNDGHRIGLVRTDDLVRNIVGAGTGSGITNITDAACLPAAPLPTCTTATLVTADNGTPATASSWLWADDTHLSPVGHGSIAAVAVRRAQNNPF